MNCKEDRCRRMGKVLVIDKIKPVKRIGNDDYAVQQGKNKQEPQKNTGFCDVRTCQIKEKPQEAKGDYAGKDHLGGINNRKRRFPSQSNGAAEERPGENNDAKNKKTSHGFPV
jgi:hypothetical protein